MGEDLEGERPGPQPEGGSGKNDGDFEMDNDDGWVGVEGFESKRCFFFLGGILCFFSAMIQKYIYIYMYMCVYIYVYIYICIYTHIQFVSWTLYFFGLKEWISTSFDGLN